MHYSGKYVCFRFSVCYAITWVFPCKEISNEFTTLSLFFLLHFQGFWTDFTVLPHMQAKPLNFGISWLQLVVVFQILRYLVIAFIHSVQHLTVKMWFTSAFPKLILFGMGHWPFSSEMFIISKCSYKGVHFQMFLLKSLRDIFIFYYFKQELFITLSHHIFPFKSQPSFISTWGPILKIADKNSPLNN